MDNIFKELANHLDRLPIPFPATENGSELKLLEHWFTIEEARIALKMNGYPEPASKIAKRLDMPEEKIAPVLMDMSKKGLLFRISKNEHLYAIVPLAEGMWEFHLKSITEKDLEYLHAYLEEFMEKSWYSTKTTQHRIIPITESISTEMEVYSYDQAEAIIKAQTTISVADCICRKENELIGKGCDHPKETCMAFNMGAHYYIDNGLGRKISQEEALGILHMAQDAGLVLQPGNGQKVWSMCMCCSCSCYLLKTLRKMDKPGQVAHSSFFAAIKEDDCTACGLCEERCPMDAITIDDVAVVDLERCIGCGVCSGACDFDAVSIRLKNAEDRYLPPKDMVHMQMEIAKERGII